MSSGPVRILNSGARRFEALTGIRPRYGGIHASGFTHNALVGLGGRCYFEVLAPVGPASPNDDEWCRLARGAHEPRILTYCLRSARPAVGTRVDRHGIRLEKCRGGEQWPHHARGGSVALAVARPGGRTVRSCLSVFHRLARLAASGRRLWYPRKPESEILLQHFAVGHPDAAELRRTSGTSARRSIRTRPTMCSFACN